MTPDMDTKKLRKKGDRPFPWPCGNCRRVEVYPEAMRYALDVKHDGQSYHLEFPSLTIPKCRACGELAFCNSVDDQILQALRTHLRLLTPDQIRNARESLGLKSKELAEKLGVAAETICRWERGGLVQSRAMDNLLRVYFAVPKVREVLRGAEQDPSLGSTVTAGAELVNGIEPVNKKLLFREFWASMAKDPRIQAHFKVKPSPEQFCTFRWGQSNANFGAMFYQRERRLFVNLCINFINPKKANTDSPAVVRQKEDQRKKQSKNLYDQLAKGPMKSQIDKDYRSQIDRSLGDEHLEWCSRDEGQESWIGASRLNVSIEDKNTWGDAREWAINRLITLKKILADRVSAVIPNADP